MKPDAKIHDIFIHKIKKKSKSCPFQLLKPTKSLSLDPYINTGLPQNSDMLTFRVRQDTIILWYNLVVQYLR